MTFSGLSQATDTEKRETPNTSYEILFSKSPEPIFALDVEGRFIFSNHKFTEFLGYDLGDLNKLQQSVIFHDLTAVRYHFELATKGTSTSFEVILKHKIGNHIPVKITLIPSMDENKMQSILGLCKSLSQSTEFKTDSHDTFKSLNHPHAFASMGTWEYDLLKTEYFWSKQMYEIFGVDHTSLTPAWNSAYKFVHPEDRKHDQNILRDALETAESTFLEYQINRSNGQQQNLLERSDIIKDKSERATNLVGTIDDITEISKVENELNKKRDQVLSIADHLYAVIWSFNNITKELTYCSSGIERFFGITVAAFKENPYILMGIIHPDDLQMAEESVGRILKGGKINSQCRVIDRNGIVKWVSVIIIPIFDREGTVTRIDGVIQDITDDKNYAETLSQMANFDYLTKLPNRHYFEKFLNRKIQKAKLDYNNSQFAVFYLDLDLFDFINDTFGHDVGDRLLEAIANRLRENLNMGAFLGRIAGDEFSILIEGIKEVNEAFTVAKRIIREMEAPFYIEGYELFVTVSIGISFFPVDGEDSHTLLKSANHALKRVKDLGRNDWQIYSPSMDVKSYKSFQLESDLHNAILNDEFFLEYQPRVDTLTGKIKGAEALIRWNHPDWGTVSPSEFIRMAEENGFIFEIGDWVLAEVCKLLGRWKEEGVTTVPISVNVSPKRLLKTDFVKSVQHLITSAGIEPDLIELELTEYEIIKNIEKTKQIISALKLFGVRFALDDFGTGYSSLSYLTELDFDTLKIDKSFIDGIGSSISNEGIIKSAIFLSKELGLDVVAEGVEEIEQFNFLLEEKCHQIQGYLFSRPVKEPELKRLLNKGIIGTKKNGRETNFW